MKFDMSKSKEIIGENNQIAAVQKNGYALRYCHQPSEAVQLEAVKQNGDALQYFKRAWIKETKRKITIEEIESELGFEVEIVK